MNTYFYFDTIYCDADGVLMNFHLEAVRAHLRVGKRIIGLQHYGTPLQLNAATLFKQYPPGLSVSKYLVPSVQDTNDHWSEEMNEFWKPIEIDPFFWRNMQPFDHAVQLLKLLRGYCKHLLIVTTPHTDPTCYHGKYDSLIKTGMLKLCTGEPIFCKEKWRLAHPSCLLIDDFSRHTESWLVECERRYERPGSAILFPGVWNENHAHWQRPVEFVKEQIEAILYAGTQPLMVKG